MPIPSKYLPWLFALLLFVISLPSVISVAHLHRLYTNSRLQQTVQNEMTIFAESRGLLLSELALTAVTEKTIRFTVREYQRGRDPQFCFVVTFFTHTTMPCDNAY